MNDGAWKRARANFEAAMKAAGNAYPVPLLCAVLSPVICLIHSEIDVFAWPNREALQGNPFSQVGEAMRQLKRTPPPTSHSKAKAKALSVRWG